MTWHRWPLAECAFVCLKVSDQLTGLLEVRARTDQAALAGEETIVGFLTEPEAGAIFRCRHVIDDKS